MNEPLLSICIPTFNRANYLKDCLNSIVYQFKDKHIFDQVEVVISDNASADNTTEIVTKFQSEYKNIKYFKNDTNLGVDRNILNIVEKSTGKYCLTIGDDDGFSPESLSFVIDKIKTLNVPYYMINSWGYDHELDLPVVSHPNIEVTEDIFYRSLSDHVQTIKKYTDLVGAFCGLSHIFDRKAWMDFNEKEKYIGTNAIHYFILLSIFKDSTCTFLAKPIIKTRSSNIRWGVFPGLGTIQGRITSTIKLVKWVKDKFNLPISNIKINLYFYSREYWFTFKEIIKKLLSNLGLEKIITIYRKIR